MTWNDFVCECPYNFTGKACETRVWCLGDPCVLGSQCVDLLDGYECEYLIQSHFWIKTHKTHPPKHTSTQGV